MIVCLLASSVRRGGGTGVHVPPQGGKKKGGKGGKGGKIMRKKGKVCTMYPPKQKSLHYVPP